jgi:hypothetical protein
VYIRHRHGDFLPCSSRCVHLQYHVIMPQSAPRRTVSTRHVSRETNTHAYDRSCSGRSPALATPNHLQPCPTGVVGNLWRSAPAARGSHPIQTTARWCNLSRRGWPRRALSRTRWYRRRLQGQRRPGARGNSAGGAGVCAAAAPLTSDTSHALRSPCRQLRASPNAHRGCEPVRVERPLAVHSREDLAIRVVLWLAVALSVCVHVSTWLRVAPPARVAVKVRAAERSPINAASLKHTHGRAWWVPHSGCHRDGARRTRRGRRVSTSCRLGSLRRPTARIFTRLT